MRVTGKGQVTIPKAVRNSLGIDTNGTEVDFVRNDAGEWVLPKAVRAGSRERFRTAHEVAARPTMTTDEILALTRG